MYKRCPLKVTAPTTMTAPFSTLSLVPSLQSVLTESFSLYPSSVMVADIKAVITGKDCPHVKEKGALKQNKVCFHNVEAFQLRFF